MTGDSRRVAHIGEGTVAVIVKEPAWTWFENPRNAVVAYTGAIGTTAERGVELSELADEKVKLSIIVVVEPDGARTPARRSHPSLFCDVGEGAVAIVAVENVATILSDVKIGKTVAVVVADGNTHSISPTGHSGPLRNVGKRPVAVVAVESIPQWLGLDCRSPISHC